MTASLPLVTLSILALSLIAILLFSGGLCQAEPQPTLVGRVSVRADGFYRIPASSLATLGVSDPARAEVRRRGRVVPRCATKRPGDLVFEARNVAGPNTALATFEIWRLPAPRSAPKTPAAPLDVGAPETRRVTRDRIYGELAAAEAEIYASPTPAWFLAGLQRGGQAGIELGPLRAAPDTPQRLRAKVFSAHRGPVVLFAAWGETDLGSARVENAVGGATLQWDVPAAAVPGASAVLRLRDRSPRPPPRAPRDVSAARGTVWVDALSLTGRTTPQPACDESAVEVEPRPAGPAPQLLRAVGDARHVIIATPPLLAGARKLAAWRTQTGLPSAAVAVTDVYDEFGFGERLPIAIRRFLDTLAARPGTPLRYVVLAGDATFDRTDIGKEVTIPTVMARTKYNGATASDRLYTRPTKVATGGASIGRLPFRTAAEMDSYVRRVVRYEQQPPADASRRMLRFITSEGRFGPVIDKLIEGKFRNILAKDVPPAYDIEVTFASASSPFLWPPPELDEKVIEGLNEGALFYTYVGHGFAQGFDTLRIGGRRYPILHISDASKVRIRGTPPVVLVIACTTAWFDGVNGDGIGESLLKQERGPVAYWGATRVCHPVYNTFVGEALARNLAKGGELSRLGDILDAARDFVLTHPPAPIIQAALRNFADVKDLGRLLREGALMYALLGDPALRVALPQEDIDVSASVGAQGDEVAARIQAKLPDGTTIQVSLEVPRNRSVDRAEAVADPADPANFASIRRTHARMNDWAVHRTTVQLKNGEAQLRLPLEGRKPKGLVVKAWAIAEGDVHQGAARLP